MDELRAGKFMATGEVILVPVERCYFQSASGNMGCWLIGLKEFFAIIVCDASGMRAFDAEANNISVDSLISKVPGLDDVLASLPL